MCRDFYIHKIMITVYMKLIELGIYYVCSLTDVFYRIGLSRDIWTWLHRLHIGIRVECGIFLLIGQNRSSNQRSGMI